MPFGDVFFSQKAVESRRTFKVYSIDVTLMRGFCFVGKVILKHLVNHLLEGDATQTIVRMDATVRCNGEVEQQRRVAAYGFIIGVHQL